MPQPHDEFLTYLVGLAGLGIAGILAWLGKNTMKRITDLETGKASTQEIEALFREIDRRKDIEAKLFDLFRDHERQDRDRFEVQEASNRDRHDELIALIGDMRADIAGLKR